MQVEHLRLENSVAFLEQLQLLFLNFEFTAQLHNLGKAAVTEPEFVLQADEHQDQENNQCLHRSMDVGLNIPESRFPRVLRGGAQHRFDAQQLVVLGDAIGA